MTTMIVIVVLVILILIVIGSYNKLVRLRNKCDEAFATMDVYLKKRFDLIPNLVETVKGYAKHETDTLQKVVAMRNSTSMSTEQRLDNENEITGTLRQIFALAERYPDLKANTNFMDLQKQLQKIEEDIANARKFYNAVVREYNDKIMTVPSNIVAGLFHFEKRPMFEADDSERENIQVKF